MSLENDAKRFRENLLRWVDKNERSFLWREPDASFYEVFMSEMFLRRTRSDVVESFIPEFLNQYPDVPALREADLEELAEVIRPMGLQNKRASGLIDLAEELEGDSLPTELDTLLQLPQVGPYVANATLCFALDEQRPIIDRNIDRIYGRIFGEDWTKMTEDEQWEFASLILPDGRARSYNLALLDFGAAICTAPKPQCPECFAMEYCNYYAEFIEE